MSDPSIRFFLGSLLLGCGLTAGIGCGGAQKNEAVPVPEPRACHALGGDNTDLWSDKVRTELELVVRVFEGTLRPADAESVTEGFKSLASEWDAASQELCDSYQASNSMTKRQYRAAQECLERIASDTQQLIEAIGGGAIDRTSEIDVLRAQISTCLDESR